MRRRRQVLQVSTFPFLAVLLCAMGSLILLLLVMDRRAKVAAQARVLATATQAAEERARLSAAQKAEWERRRRALHAFLAGQDREVVAEMEKLKDRMQSQTQELRSQETKAAQLASQVHLEKSRLDQGKTRGAGWRNEMRQKTKETEATRKDLARMAQQLAQLEQTIEEVKLLRQRDQQTYSLVPYRGRRGDSRQPIYVECAATGIVVHPERVVLQSPEATAMDVRKEMQRQVARQQQASKNVGAGKKDLPYLLLLVRPDGIAAYHQVLAAMDGIDFDFGYEFVERDWVLDFSGQGEQPWMNQGLPRAKLATRNTPSGNKKGQGEPSRIIASTEKGKVSGTPPSNSEAPTSARTIGLGNSGDPRKGSGSTPGRGGITSSGPPRGPKDSAGPLWSPSRTSDSPGGSIEPGTQGHKEGMDKPTSTSNGSARKGPDTVILRPVLLGNSGETQHPNSGGGRTQGRGSGNTAPDSGSAKNSEGPGDGGENPSGINLAGPALPSGQRRPPPLGRLIGNRNWFIPIECRAEEVIMPTARLRFAIATFQTRPNPDHPLAIAVARMIARRQATVQKGEPPYRPIIRFLVHPDGQRSYYQAYPFLGKLGVRMVRQDIEREEEKK